MRRAPVLVFTLLLLGTQLTSCTKVSSLVARQRLSTVLNDYDLHRSHKYVVFGKNGTLFYLEELRYCLLNWYKKGDNERILKFSRELARQHVSLIVVPVPTKTEVYPELLTDIDGEVCVSRRHLVEFLQRSGVNTIDLLPLFHLQKSGEPLFGRTETHWCRKGISLAADAICDRLRSVACLPSPTPTYRAKDTILDHYRGDLALKYPELADSTEPLPLSMVTQSPSVRYRDCDSSSILVFGDSFVGGVGAQYAANISAHCALRLGQAVDMYWTLGGYSNAPEKIRRLLARGNGRIKVVVWIFTCRALMESQLALN
jgi:hypothetical protein